MTKLNVMEIERFALHDGPGIRTTVFLKGCPLHCPWCQNPESQSQRKQLLYFENRCQRCGACVNACKQGAISWQDGPVFDRNACTGCEDCRRACLYDAIAFSGRWMDVEAVLAEALRDRDYYEETGGGLTISGGDPFVQFDGMMALLRRAREAGLHTTIETEGQTTPERMREAAHAADLLLFDIKHMDAEKLRQVTGGDLERILENFRAAAAGPAKTVLRMPVITGFNDDPETVMAVLRFAAETGVQEAHLLAYHTLGKSKYGQLGLKYPWPADRDMDKSLLTRYIEEAKPLGVHVQIGG